MKPEVLSQRNILLGVTGSVAAYKACLLLRQLKQAGARVKVVMTENARRFVGQAAMASLSEEQVVTDIFLPPPQQHDDHISLTQWAQLIVIAPATANIIGKAAAGIADDALSTIILSARCKTLFAPAMNAAMYNNPIVQENIVKLQRFGCEFIGPDTGALACGERGIGRLADVSDIVRKIETLLQKSC